MTHNEKTRRAVVQGFRARMLAQADAVHTHPSDMQDNDSVAQRFEEIMYRTFPAFTRVKFES